MGGVRRPRAGDSHIQRQKAQLSGLGMPGTRSVGLPVLSSARAGVSGGRGGVLWSAGAAGGGGAGPAGGVVGGPLLGAATGLAVEQVGLACGSLQSNRYCPFPRTAWAVSLRAVTPATPISRLK